MPRRSHPRRPNYDELAHSAFSLLNRLNPRARLVVAIVLAVALIAGFIYLQTHQAGSASPSGPVAAQTSPHLLLGNLSDAASDPADRDNYLMVKPYYALAYNDSAGTPNWVSWRVTRDDLGDAPRKPTFDADTTLPPAFYRVTHKDYSGGGFDRGHLCPHSDRAANREMSFATFVMTNIIPQAANVNQKAWAQLEIYCRDLVRRGQHLYISAGPIGRGGIGKYGYKETIAHGRVTVPAQCWKVILSVPQAGDDDLSKIGPGTRVIAVVMPNDDDVVGEEWAKFRTSAADVEARTRFKFFTTVPQAIADILRQKVDNTPIAPPRSLTRGNDE